MHRLMRRIKEYLFNVKIDINERLSVFFINIGIAAAYMGVAICLLSKIPITGTIATALIAVGAPLISSMTRNTGNRKRYGSLVACMIIIMIPIVWLTTGAWSGGTGFWFLYELFYITLFAKNKQLGPYITLAVFVQGIAITVEKYHPELFFHFTNRSYALVSIIGCGVVVAAEILLTVTVQKALYVHEREINTKTEDMTRDFVTSIANTIDTKDPYTGGHSRRVAECASAIALRLGMSQTEADTLYFVGLLHDIGKIGIPDSILNKSGHLTDEEFAVIRRHPLYGAEILKNITTIPHVYDGVLYHHEHYDGTGYPKGLKGEDIPYVARIISVADAYDAMSTTRIYRKYLKREDIISEFKRCRGTQFDPRVDDAFVEMLTEGFEVTNAEECCANANKSIAVSADEMMRHITKAELAMQHVSGATSVDNAYFAAMYDYLYHLSGREGSKLVLTNISIEMPGVEKNNDQLYNSMVDLSRALIKNTRSVDICTRNSPTSFLILLLNAPLDHIEQIIERVKADFYSQGNEKVILKYSTIEIDAQVHKDQ